MPVDEAVSNGITIESAVCSGVCEDSTWNPFNEGSGVCRQKRGEDLKQLGGLFTRSVMRLGSALPSLGRRKKCSGVGGWNDDILVVMIV